MIGPGNNGNQVKTDARLTTRNYGGYFAPTPLSTFDYLSEGTPGVGIHHSFILLATLLQGAMPHWHHHCGCPYHRRGCLCPVCDEPDYRPRMREGWGEPQKAESESVSGQLADLRDAIDRLTERLDALEED